MSARVRKTVGPGWLLLIVAVASACATNQNSRTQRNSVGGAISQPLRDVSLLRDTLPPVLIQAAAEPYAPPAAEPCAAIAAEIAELDAVLGPDLDKIDDQTETSAAAELATSAIGDVVNLPFRGVVRRVSGAARRDKEVAEAVLAGMVRRGFLRGLATSNACSTEPEQGAAPLPGH